jgi:hypothetical protein
MSLDTVFAAIQARIEAAWPTIEPTVPLAYPNAVSRPEASEFLLVDVTWVGGIPTTIGAPGANRVRRDGYIWLHAFITAGTGNQVRAFQIASRAATIFEEQNFADVVCIAMEPGGGQSGTEDGRWYGQSVAIPFWFDEDA